MKPEFYNALLQRLAATVGTPLYEQLGERLADSEEAMTILRAKGYEGVTLADMVRKIPPATLRHS